MQRSLSPIAAVRRLLPAAAAALGLGLAACGGGGGGLASLAGPAPAPAAGLPATGLVRKAAGFTLRVLPATFADGASARDVTLDVGPGPAGSGAAVSVGVVDAQALKGLYFELDYDPQRYDPLAAQPTAALADSATAGPDGGERTLSLGVLSQPGTAALGQALTRPAAQPGLSGDAVLARLTFAGRPFAPRQARAAPFTPRSAAALTLDNTSHRLAWNLCSQGDYDQNGETNIADLQPLSKHWHASSGGGPFPSSSLESIVDGDANGEINIADLQPIGVNYKCRVAGYRIYASPSLDDRPATPDAASALPPLAEVALADAGGDPHRERLAFVYTLAMPAPGDYYWVRPFDGDQEGTPSNSVRYATPNERPVADLTADRFGGSAPLSVALDASGSHDPDGTVVKYEFDWDGAENGQHWEDNGATPTAQHVYTAPGSYRPAVRVTDNLGAVATAVLGLPLTVTAQVNQAPSAKLKATPTGGAPPLDVAFDASGSSDSDGSIVQYDWDWDGDGLWDEGGNNATPTHRFDRQGVYNVKVRVRDNGGLVATAVRRVTVQYGPLPPSAELAADPLEGLAPLSVDFDASASEDPDGTVVKYEWDWAYDGLIFSTDLDTGATPTATHVFAQPGDYPVAVQVTDSDGLVDVNGLTIHVHGSGPDARLLATPRFGPAPLSVAFDASGSSDYDGTILQYEWDWDGDGAYDASGTVPTAQHLYTTPGVYDAQVRLTDDHGKRATKIMLVLVTAGGGLPAEDSIFALPSQSKARNGDVVTVEIYTNHAAGDFQFLNGCGITLEKGNTYAPLSYNVGAISADPQDQSVDGLWSVMHPKGFLLAPDSFIQSTDIGGGRQRIDLVVVPLGGTDIKLATGALFNFGLVVHSNVHFSFQRSDGLDRTDYSSQTGYDTYWSCDDNHGLPGITLVP
jgi:PKD repeat protein